MEYYTEDNILNKYEFASYASDKDRNYLYQDPNQILLRNYISKHTPYDSILLYHGLGSGKTCSSISIAEGFKEYIQNLDRKIVVLVKNKNIQRNFMNELLSLCTENEYISDREREEYFNITKNNEKLQNRLHRLVNKTYTFIPYGTFINNVMSMRDQFKKLDDDKKLLGNITNFNNTVVIVDEVQNIINNDGYIALKTVLSRSYNYRLILLTATPMYDNPTEIFEISNLLNANNDTLVLPIRNDLYKKGILLKESKSDGNIVKGGITTITDIGKQLLTKALKGKVSYLKSNTKTNPKKINIGEKLLATTGSTKIFPCIMSKTQLKTYLKALKTDTNFINSVDNKSKKSSGLYKNSSDASTMTYPGDTFGEEGFNNIFQKVGTEWKIKSEFKNVITSDLQLYSSKLFNLLKNINENQGNVFIYSNYVSHGGTSLIKQILLNNGYTEWRGNESSGLGNFIMYDESNNVDRRERLRRIFNSPENKDGKLIKIIIGSPIIAEGITLKNVRSVHIIDPWWNMSKINQIIGRSVRNNSHADLEPSERTVKIYKYVSLYNYTRKVDKFYKFFIDKERYILSEEKDRSNKRIERILKEISFDCELMSPRNFQNEDEDGSPECDYTSCNFSCKYQIDPKFNLEKSSDKSTYNLHLDFFDKHDIEFVTNGIKTLFSTYFIWKLPDILHHFSSLEPNLSHEAIFFSLNSIVDNKTTLLDMYNREGFIIRLGDFYVFNGYDIDINSSLYKKFFDFSVKKNKYSLDEFSKTYLGLNLNTQKTQKQKKTIETEELNEQDTLFNNDLLEKYHIIGTYRQKGMGNLFGKTDGTFRLVIRKESDKLDKRKVVTGMAIKSFKKDKLLLIISKLNIPNKSKLSFDEHSNSELANIIEKFLKNKNRVLR